MHAFDTLKYTKGAEQVGIPREQAEYQAEQLLKLVNDELATKKDIHDVKKEIKQLDVDLRKEIESLRKDVIIKLGCMMIGCSALIISVLGFLMKS